MAAQCAAICLGRLAGGYRHLCLASNKVRVHADAAVTRFAGQHVQHQAGQVVGKRFGLRVQQGGYHLQLAVAAIAAFCLLHGAVLVRLFVVGGGWLRVAMGQAAVLQLAGIAATQAFHAGNVPFAGALATAGVAHGVAAVATAQQRCHRRRVAYRAVCAFAVLQAAKVALARADDGLYLQGRTQ